MGEITRLCLNKGFLIEPELAQTFETLYSANQQFTTDVLNFMFSEGKKIITKNMLLSNSERIMLQFEKLKESSSNPSLIEQYEQQIRDIFHLQGTLPSALVLPGSEKKLLQPAPEVTDMKVIASYSIPSKKIEVDDFVKYFRTRFMTMKGFLQDRTELEGLTAINKINGQRKTISIIAMVLEKKMSKNKNLILDVEDLTGRVRLLVNAGKADVFAKAQDIVPDDILGFKCSGTNEIMFVNDIIFPEARAVEKKLTEEGYIAFISDIHAGSNRFIEEEFKKFIRWLNGEIGNEKQKEIAKNVKYVFCAGDLIDGVGIYPGQEDELSIKDVTLQYAKLAELFSPLRKDIKVILGPGNHDAVRIAEPQPLIDEKYAAALYALPNLYFVSNPAVIRVGISEKSPGLNILMYHGYSYDYFINSVDSLRNGHAYHRPELIMQFLLRRRHLAPTHAATLYIPHEKQDPLVLQEVPDVFVSGHIHKSGIATYNGIVTISCSCWQSKTPFQEKFGHEPDPGKVPIMNMKTKEVMMIDFG